MKRISALNYMDLLQCKKKFYLSREENYNLEQYSFISNEDRSLLDSLLRQKFGDGIEITTYESSEKKSEISLESCKSEQPLIYDAYFRNSKFTANAGLIFHQDGKRQIAFFRSSTSLSDTYIDHAAFNKYVMEYYFGLSVSQISVILINNTYVREQYLDAHQLFKIEDITDRVNESLMGVSDAIRTMSSVVTEPDVDIGPHCANPYQCQFTDYCWQHIPSSGSVFNIRRLHSNKKWDLYKKGVIKLIDVPDDYELTEMQANQVQIAKQKVKGTLDFQKIDLTSILDYVSNCFDYPLHFLEIDTVSSPIPPMQGFRPYQQLTFAYSLMIIDENGKVIGRRTFLPSKRKEDIALEFTRSLLSDIRDNGNIAVYNSAFGIGKLKDLQRVFPEFIEPLQAIIDRIVDLMMPFRKGWLAYSSNSTQSYSIRNITPAILNSEYYASLRSNTNTVNDISFPLLTLSLEELEEAWNMNLRAGKKKLKPLFTFKELGAYDKTIYEQISNPLVLRLFLELYHGKNLPRKSTKRLNIWNEWFLSLNVAEREFLKEVAKEIWNTGHNELMLDDLLKVDFFNEIISSGNISSPYNRLKNKGWISRYMKGLNSHLSVTVEASLFYVISHNLRYDSESLKPEEILDLLKTGTRVQKGAIESYLCETVVDDELELLSRVIDASNTQDLVHFVRPILTYMKIFGAAVAVSKLLADESSNDWVVLNLAHDHMEKAEIGELRKDLSREILFTNPLNDYHSIRLALNSILLLDELEIGYVNDYLKRIDLLKYGLGDNNYLLRALGKCHFKIGQHERAVEYFEECMVVLLGDGQDHKEALSLVFGDLGKIYLEQGNFIKARDYFEKAVEKDRDNMDALEILAETNENVGDIVDALNDHIRLCEMRYHHFGSMDPLTKQSIEKVRTLMAETGKNVPLPDWFYSK